jgi:hypothetical protein
MSTIDYLELLDASSRMVRSDKRGYTPSEVAPIFERLKLDPEYWRLQIQNFGRLFANVAEDERTFRSKRTARFARVQKRGQVQRSRYRAQPRD